MPSCYAVEQEKALQQAEYYPLVRRLHGQVIRISPTSTQYVNPMDINLNYSEDDNPLALKSDFLLSAVLHWDSFIIPYTMLFRGFPHNPHLSAHIFLTSLRLTFAPQNTVDVAYTNRTPKENL